MTAVGSSELARRLAVFARRSGPDVALPGRGDTPSRFAALMDVARGDLSLARLCEAHLDALAILADGGRPPTPHATYGVWAARSRHEVVRAVRQDDGWHLTGRKPWCSGVGIVSHALLTAETPQGTLLVEVALDDTGIGVADTPWATPAFGATGTATLAVDTVVGPDQQVGAIGFYLARPGFWHGASGVAACWAGGLHGMMDRAKPWWRDDAHAIAHRAAADSHAWAATELVMATARDADTHPHDGGHAQRMALRVRHLVDAAVAQTSNHVRRGCGPAPLAFDDDLSRHSSELELYVRQCHAERDLEALGRLLDAQPPDHPDGWSNTGSAAAGAPSP